jgi:phosphoserine phosphatase RsbU/P
VRRPRYPAPLRTRTYAAGRPRTHGQLFSNLLGNAVTHGAESEPVKVGAEIRNGAFELAMSNGAEAIPAEVIERLFQPFYRGNPARRTSGLGLGLYIASQIAMAHQGRLDVDSDEQATTFTFRMPIAAWQGRT